MLANSSLNLGGRTLLNPGLDGLQSVGGFDHTTKSWIGFQQITLDHVVHVVGDAGKVNIGPGELIEEMRV